jgi:hypothetical protein
MKAFEVCLRARERGHELRRDRTQHRQPLAYAADQLIDAPQVGLTLALRTVAQALARLFFGALIQRLQKQARVIDHPLANAASGLLVMLEPQAELARRQPRLPLRAQ